MLQTRKVLLYGKSMGIAALEASLAPVRGFEVERLDASSGDLIEAVRELAPDCVVFELGALPDHAALTLLTEVPGVDLIGIDLVTNRLLVLTVQQHTAPNTADLVRVIQEKGLAA